MKKPVTIQVNASGKGLGAALIQDDGPVTFASKVLTPTEQCYANNERELLACVFGAECFWTYVFGRHFTIESDHKSRDHIRECHPDAVKPDMPPKVAVAGQPVTTPSTSEAVQLQQTPTAPAVQPSVAPATLKQAAARSPTAATHIQRKAPITTDVQPLTGRTDVAPRQSGHISKAPQCLIEHM